MTHNGARYENIVQDLISKLDKERDESEFWRTAIDVIGEKRRVIP
jgi:hypothetical protein